MSFLVLPSLLRRLPELIGKEAPPMPVPLWILILASTVQSAAFLTVAVWLGTALAPAVGLHAPAIEAVLSGSPAARVFRSQLLWGGTGGALGGLLLILFLRFAPPALLTAQSRLSAPLAARVLYGGITEEILLRWGFMTLLVWLGWRFLQRRQGPPKTIYVWLAIVVSALLFGAGHLPMAGFLVGELTPILVAWVVGANALFGVMAGYLFWRHGLESAIIAHALTHVVSYVFTMI